MNGRMMQPIRGRRDSPNGLLSPEPPAERQIDGAPGGDAHRSPPLRDYSAWSSSSQGSARPLHGRALGPARLQRRMNQIAATPSFQPIFFPSS